jgi:2'-5' RNA ligase
MPRLFVAIDLPDTVKDGLEPMCFGVEGARWVQERQFHLTLAFLGELSGPQAARIEQGLMRVRGDPFELQLQGVGHFPPRGAPKQLWAGVEACDELTELHERVLSAVRQCGLKPETRRYHPHVTLGRLRHAPLPSVAGFLEANALQRSEPFAVTDFQLFRSVLARSGAQYSIQASYPLFERRA